MGPDTLLAFLKANAFSLWAFVRGEVKSPRIALRTQTSPCLQGSWRGLQPGEQHYFNTRRDSQFSRSTTKSIADVPRSEHLRSGFWKLGEFTHSAALIPLSEFNNVAELHSRLAFMCLSQYDAEPIQALHALL